MPISVTLILIAITVITSLLAWQNSNLMEKWVHHPPSVAQGEWWRLLTSGFLHADFIHLFFNMFAFYSFGQIVEGTLIQKYGQTTGVGIYVALYLLAIILSDLPTYFKHKHQNNYYSLGASGGVAAIIFASIYFYPISEIMIFPIPFGIKGYVFGGLYLGYSYYLSTKGTDGINHSAHFYGAAIGLVASIALIPEHMSTFIALILQ